LREQARDMAEQLKGLGPVLREGGNPVDDRPRR
jgi:hypothetical protein